MFQKPSHVDQVRFYAPKHQLQPLPQRNNKMASVKRAMDGTGFLFWLGVMP